MNTKQTIDAVAARVLDATDPAATIAQDGLMQVDPVGAARREQPLPCTDVGNAERFAYWQSKRVRFDTGLGRWRVWDGARWALDETGDVRRRAVQTVRAIHREAGAVEAESDSGAASRKALTKWALASESKTRITALLDLAQAHPALAVASREFDRDPFLFNCANGTIDLRTGELRPHRQQDLITRVSPVIYDREARSEVWDAFISTVTGGNNDLARFLQRAAGYTLTGDTGEEVLFFAHGPAATGKSTFLESLRGILGDYARTADFESFTRRSGDSGVRNDLARLVGARLVTACEVQEGKALAEALVKFITGNDTISARFLYGEYFEYRPSFKLWLAANHAPKVDADDEAMWRRILRLPFDQVVEPGKRNPKIKEFLRDPAGGGPAILAWAVAGCLDWQRNRLGVPEVVQQATAAYREDCDPLRDFLETECELRPDAWTLTSDLWGRYQRWATETGLRFAMSQRTLAARLRARGCADERHNAGRGWRGIALRGA